MKILNFNIIETVGKDQGRRGLAIDGKYQIPNFNSLFTYNVNPFFNDKTLVNKDWMIHFSLVSKEQYERRIREAGIMTTSYMYPYCKEKYRLASLIKKSQRIHIFFSRFQRLVNWMAHLYIFDDEVEVGRGTKPNRSHSRSASNLYKTV